MKRFVLAASAICISSASILAEPTIGKIYQISFTDVDGNALSTAAGRITTVILTGKANIDKARLVGDRSPDFCLGNADYRLITVLTFQSKHGGAMRAVIKSVMRHRLDSEGRQLQTRYEKLKISRDARHDVFAVADFDNAVAAQLGTNPDAGLFRVFIFGKNGELLKQWNDVPSAGELAAAAAPK